MVHFADDLGGHVSGCPAGVLGVVGLDFSRDTEVCDSDIAALVEDKVFGFEVAVYDPAGVHILEAEDDTGDEESGFDFAENAVVAEMVPHISSIAVVHDKIEVLSILERADHVDEEGVFQFDQ